MDYESKILLNNLADAVCNPDWWIVATSFLGIIASLAISILLYKTTRKIGEQQNRIQREQLLISNFNLYRDIHRDLYNLKIYSNVVLPRIYDYLASNANLIEKKNLEKLETDFENMTCKVEIDEADYLLRFGENEIIQELKSYSDLISIIVGIVTAFKSKKPNTYTFEEKLRIRSLNPTDKQWLIEIEKKCDSKKIISILKFFIEEKYRLFEGENNVLKNIQTAYRDCEYANNNLSENKLR
ncbi:MAG: hypothetical protein KH375_03745 [Alistipes sp.]|nr:hypothetical protein [Alistipes sp.]